MKIALVNPVVNAEMRMLIIAAVVGCWPATMRRKTVRTCKIQPGMDSNTISPILVHAARGTKEQDTENETGDVLVCGVNK